MTDVTGLCCYESVDVVGLKIATSDRHLSSPDC